MRAYLTTVLVLLPAAIWAQTSPRFERITAPLFDLVVFSDSTYGVQLLASPNLLSVTGYKKGQTNRLSLLSPDIAEWSAAAKRLLDSPPLAPSASPGKFAGVQLKADRGRSTLTLGYDPMGPVNERFFLIIAEMGSPPWRAALPDFSVRTLLTALATATARSALSDPDAGGPSRAYLGCELDRMPRVTGRPSVHYPRMHPYKEGRVWAEFVVTPAGRVDSSTVQVLLSDDPAFEREARSTLRSIRFSPGELHGAPVSVLVFQQFAFKVRL